MECGLLKAGKWEELCDNINADIYFYPQYAKVFEMHGEGEAQCFYYSESLDDFVIYPFLLRNIPGIEDYYDIITPYGYGGYFPSSKKINKQNFFNKFHAFCLENHIVSEFVRFHPLYGNYEFADNYIETIKLSQTIAIDLRKDKELLWKELDPKNRNKVRKATKNGITIKQDIKLADLEEFVNIYNATMDKNSAVDYYYFGDDFFEITKELLSAGNSNITMFQAILNDEPIAASLFIYTNKYIHYHFSGAKKEYLKYAPNNLLLYTVALWAKDNGMELFHLGGGLKANDSLFSFKKSFSPLSFNFYIGRHIHDDAIYKRLCNEKINKEKIDVQDLYERSFFPLYRS